MTTNDSLPRPDLDAERLLSPAWLIGGLRNVPGYLSLAGGRLAFVSDETVFDVPAREAAHVAWPWWWFGGGFTMTAAGKRYKITFIRPNGMPAPSTSMLDPIVDLLGGPGGFDDLGGLGDIGRGRAVAKQWKELYPPSQG